MHRATDVEGTGGILPDPSGIDPAEYGIQTVRHWIIYSGQGAQCRTGRAGSEALVQYLSKYMGGVPRGALGPSDARKAR